MNTRLAYFISVALHPLLMPTWLFSLLFFVAPTPLGAESLSPLMKWAVIGFIFIYTFALPAYFIYSLKRWGYISSIQLENLSERRLPYFITALIYALLAYFLYTKNSMLFPCSYLLWGMAIVIFLVGIISFWWQISAHGAGIGGIVGTLSSLLILFGESNLFFPFLFILILAGYVLAARLALNAHTSSQVFVGFLLGFLVSMLTVLILF